MYLHRAFEINQKKTIENTHHELGSYVYRSEGVWDIPHHTALMILGELEYGWTMDPSMDLILEILVTTSPAESERTRSIKISYFVYLMILGLCTCSAHAKQFSDGTGLYQPLPITFLSQMTKDRAN